MKKNELSIWTLSCRKLYYVKHPIKFFKEIYWNFRNFIHRGRYGYAYSDVCSWYYWYTKVGAESLRYLAEHHHGYPGYEPWETPEKWAKYLNSLADKLEYCGKTCEFDDTENEYEEAMNEIYKRCNRTEKGKDGYWRSWLEMTPEDEAIRDKYFARQEEIAEEQEVKRAEIFKEIGKILPRIWD